MGQGVYRIQTVPMAEVKVFFDLYLTKSLNVHLLYLKMKH